jgi:hypothetical protein
MIGPDCMADGVRLGRVNLIAAVALETDRAVVLVRHFPSLVRMNTRASFEIFI